MLSPLQSLFADPALTGATQPYSTLLGSLFARPTIAPPAPRAEFTRLPLYPKQAAIIDDPARFTITEATTKAGKTMSHIEWLLENGIRANEGEWWWVATVTDVADIAFRRTVRRLEGYIDSGGELRRIAEKRIPFEQNLTRKIIKVGGATFWFKSADHPDSLFGEDVRGAVGDEVTRWKEQAWFALYTTLVGTKGRAKLIGNVKGRRNFAYKLARKAEAGEPDWGYHKLTAYDAVAGGVINQTVVDQAKRDLPEDIFRELFEAEAADDVSNPFGSEAIRECIIGDELSNGTPVAWGWDLAKSHDWTAGIALDANGHVCRLVRYQRPWNDTIADIRRLTNEPALVDSTGVGDPVLEALQRDRSNFEGFKFSAPSKQQLMEGLAVAIQRSEIGFPRGVITSELEAFEYEYTRTGVHYSAPSGVHDDCVCALALAWQCYQSRRVPLVAPVGTTVKSYWRM